MVVNTAPARADLHQDVQKLLESYAEKLSSLARWCKERGLTEEAKKTGRWLRPATPNKTFIPILPKRVGRPPLPQEIPKDIVEWNDRFEQLRREQAVGLYGLAKKAIRRRQPSIAIDLVMAAVHEDPDNEAVRKILGYQKYNGNWHTQFEIRKLRSGHVHHERFGWLPKSHVGRYENGERFFKGRWISIDEDNRLRKDIKNGWTIETEHYKIRTNHSLEASIALGARLERLYVVWKQLFVRFFATDPQVYALFDGRTKKRNISLPRHNVVFFRDRDEYNRSLKALMPNIDVSVGLYDQRTRCVYFFAEDNQDFRTLRHEATHQLFHESRPVAKAVGGRCNFWAIEGIAMYMESLRKEDNWNVLGGFDDARMVAARYRLLNDNFYVPLREFVGYGMTRIQNDKRIATLYSQAAGLMQFLIYYDDGRYRDAVVSYLKEIYSGRDSRTTLARLTGTSYAELDRQYRQFMKNAVTKPAGNQDRR